MTYRFCGSKLKQWKDIDISNIDNIAVAVICGSFNPMHQAHIDMYNVVGDVLKENGRHRSLLVGGFVSPVNDRYEKEGLHSFTERAAVCEASLVNHPALSVDRWEGLQPKYVYTVFVLEHMQQEVQKWYEEDAQPDAAQLSWIRQHPVLTIFVCGSDLFSSFLIPNCWQLPLLERLLDNFDVLVLRRSGTSGCKEVLESHGSVIHQNLVETDESTVLLTLDLSRYSFIESELLSSPITSTDIRERLLRDPNTDLVSLVPPTAIDLVRAYYGRGAATTQ
uniref:Cytidyltransferase-like domain-containing protein n=1 Tax=Trypanosoma congolense (strain IL3000) TaxID=1068625 RepID=G0UMZ7_TRYCI|nr:conserved hypothetical protein [Trypanosoma congolense IL3000]